MAERQQISAFPAPPPFYKHFTKRNIDLDKRRKRAQPSEDGTNTAQAADPAVERALKYLSPPEPPHDGRWRAFGIEHDLNAAEPSLKDAGIEQLFPDHPSVKLAPQAYLLSMARSLLTTFLAMTGVLAQDPTLYAKKVEDLRTITINMHYLINQYRPHQARETLIGLMEDRLENMRADIAAIDQVKEKLNGFSQQLKSVESVDADPVSSNGRETKAVSQHHTNDQDLQTLWEILDDIPQPKSDTAESMDGVT